MRTIAKIVTFLRSEPALVRAAGVFLVGALASAGLTVTSQQEASIAAGGMAVLALIQGWRTRAHTVPTGKHETVLQDLADAIAPVVQDGGLDGVMGAWRNTVPELPATAVPEHPVEEPNNATA